MSEINVTCWVELFEAVGVDKVGRQRWHAEFERRHPAGHQSFLEWLGLDAAHVDEVRTGSRKPV